MSKKFIFLFLSISHLVFAQKAEIEKGYFPKQHEWQKRTPQAMGLSSDKIQEAIAFHLKNEIKN
jgi:hypothetical protein